ncbi:MAG: NYN domain-containing protein [Candidatus Eisenbacteria bacterium]
MRRVAFLIDGFNLYHSTLELKRNTGQRAKWLNVGSLCTSYLYMFGKDACLAGVRYFSAPPHYLSPRDPGKVLRHETYMRCLRTTGIEVELARFKVKEVFCDSCQSWIIKHEEKETDVAIAVRAMELFIDDRADALVIVSGDTDFSPLVRVCSRLFPQNDILFAFPYARKNKELVQIAPMSFSIGRVQYIKHQFPNPFILPDGTRIHKPAEW